ncbi:MAG: hypothetical protein Sapg2KO_53460 [Saprospiraceae bacterium]
MLQNIQCSTPLNPLLKKRIAYYYFIKEDNLKEPLAFKYYPHYYSTLNFYKNAQLDLKNRTRLIEATQENVIQCIYSNNIKEPKRTIINGALNVIGIVFQPLGFNYFFPKQFHTGPQEYQLEMPNPKWSKQINAIYSATSIAVKTQLLDQLLAAKYMDLETPLLQRAIDYIIERKGAIELLALSQQFCVSRRTMLRYFKQYLGCSFSDFKAVVKFRFAFQEGVKGNDKLSALAYEHNYYDQSDFNKHFKAKTNETPKKMMATVTKVSEELLWKLEPAV